MTNYQTIDPEKYQKALDLISQGQILIQNGLKEAYDLDWENDENFQGTPDRVARAILERCVGINSIDKCAKILEKTFPSTYNDMVIVGPIVVDGLCPHHFENVRFIVRIGYIIGEKCVGLSKLGRVVELYGRQPILQETYTHNLADLFEKYLKPQGLIVTAHAQHSCMTCRGLDQKTAQAITSVVRGSLLDNPTTRQEFFELWKLSKGEHFS